MISLRLATAEDLPALERWSFSFERDGLHFPSDPGPPFIAETWRRFSVEPGRGEVLVIERAGQPAGYAIVLFYWSNEQRGEVALLDELWLDPSHRGGVGGEVLRGLIERARSRGAKVIALEVLDANPRAASLYERHGFLADRRGYWRKV